MKQFNVLSVCGSGTVTSSMVAGKLKEVLGNKGISITTTEARPTEALNLAQSGRFDFITFTSPLPNRRLWNTNYKCICLPNWYRGRGIL